MENRNLVTRITPASPQESVNQSITQGSKTMPQELQTIANPSDCLLTLNERKTIADVQILLKDRLDLNRIPTANVTETDRFKVVSVLIPK